MTSAIAAGHPATVAAAEHVLRAGGNAFDAVVAAGFACAVAEPVLTSLGGGGFLLARTAAGDEILFDFFVDTPGRELPGSDLEPHFLPVNVHFGSTEQEFNVGLGSVAVPGNLQGYLHAHRRLGRLPLAQVVAPAVHLARDGVLLTAEQAYMVSLVSPILTLMEPGRAIFAPQGRPLAEGERLVNIELADFIERLPAGAEEDFYRGDIARRIQSDMHGGGGMLTAADLEAYAVVERKPLAVSYRGHRLLTNAPPSFGGLLLALSLGLLDEQEFIADGAGGPAHAAALAAVMIEAERLRASEWNLVDPLTAEARADAAQRVRLATRGTTHISVADAEGNVASMTTSNGEGSGYIAPGTGVMLNNMMGEDDLHPDGFHAAPPGLRVASMMAPSILARDGQVRAVLGSGGSKRIRTALLQAVSLLVDFDFSVRDAVEAPRLHWDGDHLQVEPGLGEEAMRALRRRWPVNLWPQRNLYFGGVNAVSPGKEAHADPRRGGHAVVFDAT